MKVIWSIEHKAWWRPKSNGYTNNLASAGLYEEDEASSIVNATNGVEEDAISLEKAFTSLQAQALAADNALTELRGKLREMESIMLTTHFLQRT